MGAEQDIFDEHITDEGAKTQDQEPASDEGAEDTSASDDKKEDGTPAKQEPLSLETLNAKLETLTKESEGRLKTIRSERKARQQAVTELSELKGKVDALTNLLSEAKAKRTAAATEGTEGADKEATVKVGKQTIPVKFDEEGNPYLDPEDLKGLTVKQAKAVEDKVEKMEMNQMLLSQQQAVKTNIEKTLATDESYPAAFKGLWSAYALADKTLGKIVEDEGLEVKKLDLETAIELLENNPAFMKEFNATFPGADLDTVIDGIHSLSQAERTGQFTKRKLVKALNLFKPNGDSAAAKTGADKLSKLKALGKKPSNLSGLRNQGASGVNKAVDDLTVNDILSMSDTDIAKLEQTLRSLEEGG